MIIFIMILVVLNVLVFLGAKKSWMVWRMAGIIFIISSPFVLFITINVIGRKTGDGIGGAVAGFTFATLIVINAIAFFITSSFARRK
ncbi:hypothetical protein [Bacillus sp. B-jedd]|uniref:hypothetical protein n=1 Tax=Bacillus sp. B-jedd TaxID=1476857 RepID=UPI00051568F2|nr:hypothetical protein [Bacillus sp. B-jedd]CEG26231.1 Hypothetical protein BN1002_01073 [Bacillus sp. B-jedd]